MKQELKKGDIILIFTSPLSNKKEKAKVLFVGKPDSNNWYEVHYKLTAKKYKQDNLFKTHFKFKPFSSGEPMKVLVELETEDIADLREMLEQKKDELKAGKLKVDKTFHKALDFQLENIIYLLEKLTF